MKPSEIAAAYNQITHLWLDEKFDRNNGIAQHTRALNFVKNKGRALDVGCGCTGRMIELMQEHGFKAENIEGIDYSEKMIALAQQRDPLVTFHHQDICELALVNQYDFISAWDSIWHIPLAQQKNVLSKLVAGLNVNGIFIFSCGGTDEQDDHRDSTMGPEVYYSTLGINGFIELFLTLGCTIRHFEFDDYPGLHTHFIVQKI